MFPISPQEERLLAEGNNYTRNERKISKYRINVSPLSQTSRMGIPPHSVNRGCVKQREELPIFQFKEQILEMIDQNNVLLVLGHTGSGKTTQVPQFIMENANKLNKPCRVVCCQPRRISAISVSERVAFERNESIGTTVGYQIRLESRLAPNSNLIYCTNGVLLRCLMGGKPEELFANLTHLIIDEVHERDKFTDFLLITIREYLHINPNLKVIIMSATIDASTFTNYFYNCPVMEIPGKLFEVENHYLEDILKITKFSNKKVEDLNEKFSRNEQHLLREQANKTIALMNTIEEKSFYENLDQETRELLNETMEAISQAENPEDALNQFFYLVDGENIPVDVRSEETNMTVLMILAGRGLIEHVKTLLTMGANPGLTVCFGGLAITASDIAREHGHPDIAATIDHFIALSKENDINYLSDSKLYDKLLLNIYHDSRNKSSGRMEFFEDEIDLELIFKLIEHIHFKSEDRGAILVFLPGYEDILQLNLLITSNLSLVNDYRVYMLHSNMQTIDQKLVFKPSEFGQRKIILSTNIAETSITINDVIYVIDSGKEKQKTFDSISNSSSLQAQFISKACAKQRAGRAGRLQKGVTYRMYSRDRYEHMHEYTIPEILRTPLTELSLQAKLLAAKDMLIEDFLMKAITPPPISSIRQSVKLLKNIGALDEQENLTQLGVHLADLPVDVHLGKMLIYAIIFKCIDPILTIVSVLSVNDPFTLPVRDSDRRMLILLRKELAENSFSDHLVLLKIFQRWNHFKSERNFDNQFNQKNFINGGIMERIFGIRSQIIGQLRSVGLVSSQGNLQYLNENSGKWCVVKAILCAGLYPNVAKINKSNATMESQVDKKLSIHMSSVLREKSLAKERSAFQHFPSEYLLFEEKVRIRINLCKTNTLIHPIAIILLAGKFDMTEIAEEEEVSEDEEKQEKPEQEKLCTISIDNWIKFTTDLETGFLLQQIRKKLDALLINYLTHTKDFYFQNSDCILISSVVKILEEEDKALGFQTVHQGIGTRPRAVTLKFSSDYNHGTPEFEHNEQNVSQKFFKSNNQGGNLGNSRNSQNWRNAPKNKLEMPGNQNQQWRQVSSAPNLQNQTQNYQNQNQQRFVQRDRQWTHKNLNQNSQQQPQQQQQRMKNQASTSRYVPQMNIKYRYFIAVFPNQGFVNNLMRFGNFELDQQFNSDGFNALIQNEPHRKLVIYVMDRTFCTIGQAGFVVRENNKIVCKFVGNSRTVNLNHVNSAAGVLNEINRNYPGKKIFEVSESLGGFLWNRNN